MWKNDRQRSGGPHEPVVSVLMPARDAARTLPAALGSVLRSVDCDLEVVLVDHASRDATADIARAAAARDPRVRVISAAAELTLAEVLEHGRHACRAPYIARMDADDLMHPRRLHADVAVLERCPDIGVVACRTRLFPSDRVGAGMQAYVRWQNTLLTHEDHARDIWIEQPFCHPATTLRAAALEQVGGYRAGWFPEDYDLYLRLFLAGVRFLKRPVVHHGWREHARRVTHTNGRSHRDAFASVKARYLQTKYQLSERQVFIAGAGKEGGRIARSLAHYGVRPHCFFDVSPARIGRMRYGVPVLAREQMQEERTRVPRAFCIGAVGTSGARGGVRQHLADAGFVEGVDAVVVA